MDGTSVTPAKVLVVKEQLQTTDIPFIDRLPPDALLTRKQMVSLSGFKISAFKKWAREKRGPRITVVEGLPRYRVADARVWLGGTTA